MFAFLVFPLCEDYNKHVHYHENVHGAIESKFVKSN